MHDGALGKDFEDGQTVVRQGEPGDCMFVVQKGQLEVYAEGARGKTLLGMLEPGDVFGEMALFTNAPRSATVRARGPVRVLTIDKRGFMRRVQEDPSLAFSVLKQMSERIQRLDREVLRLKTSDTDST